MSFKAIRPFLAAFLIAAFVVSLLPVTYASEGGQSAQGSQARRGKNGASVANASVANRPSNAPEAESSQQPAADQPEPASLTERDLKSKNSANLSGDKVPVLSFESGGRSASESTSFANMQGRAENKRKAEPPPFDRPPLANDKSEEYVPPATRPQPSRPQPSSPQPSGPPVLNRPPDSESRNPGRSIPSDQDPHSGRERPVLRRPSDSHDQQSEPSRERAPDERQNRGQQSGSNQGQGDDEQIVKLESTLVNIPLLVSDRSGRYVPQLSKNDFVLYEDGTQQEIASFGSEEVPFNVVLLLDISPSVQGNVEDIQDAALAFVHQLRSQDRVMVVSFDRSTHYLTDFTNDRRHLEWAIRSVSIGSGTSVYDAVYETVSQRLKGIEGRKALILFSDGEDTTSSHASYDDAINIVSESDVLVYGLRYPGAGGGAQVDPWPRNPIPNIPFPLPFPWPFPRRRRGPFTLTNPNGNGSSTTATAPAAQSLQRRRGQHHGGDFMADITAAGGGPVYDAERVGDLSRLAYRIAEELRHVYVLSYYPSNPLSNGGFRSIRIRVKNRDDIAVRHRRGYNAREVGH